MSKAWDSAVCWWCWNSLVSLGIHMSVCFTVGVCSVVGLVFFVYSVLFITIPFYLELTCITEWLERLREAVDLSPANPAELVISHHCSAYSISKTLVAWASKHPAQIKKACCPCLGHDGGKTTCPDKAGSLGREFQCSASVSALCWVCKSLLDQGMLGGTRRIPCEQARLLLWQ